MASASPTSTSDLPAMLVDGTADDGLHSATSPQPPIPAGTAAAHTLSHRKRHAHALVDDLYCDACQLPCKEARQ